MPDEHVALLVKVVKKDPWSYLSEIASELNRLTRTDYSRQYVHGALLRAGLSLKTMQRKAAERDEAKRDLYWEYVWDHVIDWRQLMFADETAMDGRTLRRKRGWGMRGARVRVREIFHRGRMISVLALYTWRGFASFRYVEGGYKAEYFLEHMGEMIDEVMQEYPNPCSVLVLDNCGIHHTFRAELKEKVERKGGLLIFLAPYSPIDSPIEAGFNVFKACWRKHGKWLQHQNLEDAIEWTLRNCYTNAEASAARSYNP